MDKTNELMKFGDVQVPSGLPLVAALTGFMDTGSTVAQVIEHFTEQLELVTVAEYDLDEFYDYRARRPIISFDQDHLTDYQPPHLTLSLVTDEIGSQFLFLHGVEPDFRWAAFTRSIAEFVDRFFRSEFHLGPRNSYAGTTHPAPAGDCFGKPCRFG